jgi:hypothetical protein
MAHNCLPVNWNIERRGIDMEPLCPVCKRLNEDGGHLFLNCKGVRVIWRELGLEDVKSKLNECQGPKQMITTIMQQSTKVKLNCIALLWSWWKTRNRLNTEGGNWRQDQVVIQVQRLAAEYEFFVKDKKDLVQGTPRWKPPEGDVLKINFDGAFDPVSHSGGWGFVVRNSLGEVVGAAAGRLDHVNEALQAEAEACSRALSIVQKWGISRIVLESDSQILVRAINLDEDDRGPNGVLFKEINCS